MSIKKIIVFSFCIVLVLITSCKKQDKLLGVDYITHEYINDLIEMKIPKKDNHVLSINKDSTNKKYNVYRISLSASLLETNELPNRIAIYKGIKLAFFTKRVVEKKKTDSIIKSLKENSFYKTDQFSVYSNYPEWIILNNKKTGKQLIVKDMWYQPLDSILKKYREKID